MTGNKVKGGMQHVYLSMRGSGFFGAWLLHIHTLGGEEIMEFRKYAYNLDSLNTKDEITEGQSRENAHESIEIHETKEKNENGFLNTRG